MLDIRPFQGGLAQLLTLLGRVNPDGSCRDKLPDSYILYELELSLWFATEAMGDDTLPPSELTTYASDTAKANTYLPLRRLNLFRSVKREVQALNQGIFLTPFPLIGSPSHQFFVGLCMRSLREEGLCGPNLRLVPLLSQELATGLPLPFADSDTDDTDCCGGWVRARANLLFKQLQVGTTEWCGYLSKFRSFGSLNIFVEGIQFQNQDEPSEALGSVRGTGKEEMTSFTLEGYFRHDLSVSLEQVSTHPSYPQWHWTGSITLFGMIGRTVERRGGESIGEGYFWIWPKSWM